MSLGKHAGNVRNMGQLEYTFAVRNKECANKLSYLELKNRIQRNVILYFCKSQHSCFCNILQR